MTEGWFQIQTGYLARLDEDDCYLVIDRIKDIDKSGGETASSVEVEQVLADHADILVVAVIGVRHDCWGQVRLAIATARDVAVPTLEPLRAQCEGRLARYTLPHLLELVYTPPRNVTGKVAKDHLRIRFDGAATA